MFKEVKSETDKVGSLGLAGVAGTLDFPAAEINSSPPKSPSSGPEERSGDGGELSSEADEFAEDRQIHLEYLTKRVKEETDKFDGSDMSSVSNALTIALMAASMDLAQKGKLDEITRNLLAMTIKRLPRVCAVPLCLEENGSYTLIGGDEHQQGQRVHTAGALYELLEKEGLLAGAELPENQVYFFPPTLFKRHVNVASCRSTCMFLDEGLFEPSGSVLVLHNVADQVAEAIRSESGQKMHDAVEKLTGMLMSDFGENMHGRLFAKVCRVLVKEAAMHCPRDEAL